MTKDYLYAFQTWRYDEPCMPSKFDHLKYLETLVTTGPRYLKSLNKYSIES